MHDRACFCCTQLSGALSDSCGAQALLAVTASTIRITAIKQTSSQVILQATTALLFTGLLIYQSTVQDQV